MKGDLIGDYYDRQLARQEKYKQRDADAAIGRAFREAFGPDVSVEDVVKLKDALNEIASWDEGAQVDGSFDEPYSARIARKAIARLNRRPDASH